MAYIKNLVSYIPNKIVSLEHFVGKGKFDTSEYTRLSSQGYHSIAVDNTTSLEMISDVLNQLFYEKQVNPSNIRYLILTYQLYSFPFEVEMLNELKNRFKLKNCKAFSVREQHCSTLLMGIEVANTLLETHPHEKNHFHPEAIVISVGKSVLPENRFDGVFITGDSSVAIHLSTENKGHEIIAIKNITDTRTISTSRPRGGPRWDISYMVNMVSIIKDVLMKSDIKIEDIKKVIPNNAPTEMWTYLANLIKIPVKDFFIEGREILGHYFMSDIALNFEYCLEKNLLSEGYFILLGLGSEGAAGCILCKFRQDK
ncbi:hypothetical protein [Cytobacillus firmus]|uniref:hypothetical protein n=1 Tax=Cytobacillus firmus TaxID=1399 RepID=UPI0030021E5F